MLLPRLRDTLSFFWQHLADLLWLLAPLLLPLLLLADYRLLFVHGGRPETALLDPLMLLPQLLAGVFAAAAAIRFTAARQRGESPAFGELWAGALRGAPSLVVVQMLAGLAIVGGLLLLILPGLFLMGVLLPAYVVAVEERAGPLAALQAAWARFRRQAWMTSAGLCLLFSLLIVVLSGLDALAGLLGDVPEWLRLVANSGLDLVGMLFTQLIAIFLVHVTAAAQAGKPAA